MNEFEIHKANEIVYPTDQHLVNTVEQDIHEKICKISEDNWKPLCIILNKEAYLALCYTFAKQRHYLTGGNIHDLESYRDIMVILDVSASDNVRILRRPYEELVYPIANNERDVGGD